MHNEVKRQAIRDEEIEYWILTLSMSFIGGVVVYLLILNFTK